MDEIARDKPELAVSPQSPRNPIVAEAGIAPKPRPLNWRALLSQQAVQTEKFRLQARRDGRLFALVGFGFFIVSRLAFSLAAILQNLEPALHLLGILSTIAAAVIGLFAMLKMLETGEPTTRNGPSESPETTTVKRDMWLVMKLAILFFIVGQIAFVISKKFDYVGSGPRPLDVFGIVCIVSACVLGVWAFVKSGLIWTK